MIITPDSYGKLPHRRAIANHIITTTRPHPRQGHGDPKRRDRHRSRLDAGPRPRHPNSEPPTRVLTGARSRNDRSRSTPILGPSDAPFRPGPSSD